MSDYDTINYAFSPRIADKLTVFHPRNNPCLVEAPLGALEQAIEGFLSYTAEDQVLTDGRPHCSDMWFFMKNYPQLGLRDCISFGEEGWETAPTVHYGNSRIEPWIDRGMKKYEVVQQSRSLD